MYILCFSIMLFKRKATIKLFIRHATRTFSNVLEISYDLNKGHFKRNVGKIIEHPLQEGENPKP